MWVTANSFHSFCEDLRSYRVADINKGLAALYVCVGGYSGLKSNDFECIGNRKRRIDVYVLYCYLSF